MKISIIILFILLFNYGCDICDSSNIGSGTGAIKIFCTVKPMNSEIPSIFSLEPNSAKIKEIIREGVLYSAPAQNGLLVYLKNISDGSNQLWKSNIVGSEQELITNSILVGGNISYPEISFDGNFICFIESNSKLWLYETNGVKRERYSSSILNNTLPSFSPDSKWLAYIESMANGLKINIIDVNNRGNVLYSSKFSTSTNIYRDSKLAWSSDSRKLIFHTSEDSTNICIVLEPYSTIKEKKFEIKNMDISSVEFAEDNFSFIFTNENGEIWKATPENDKIKYLWKLTDDMVDSFYSRPNFSSESGQWLLIQYLLNKDEKNLGTLYIAKLIDNKFKSNLLINNVINAFWQK